MYGSKGMFQLFLTVSRRKFERIASASIPTKTSGSAQLQGEKLRIKLKLKLLDWSKTQKVLRKSQSPRKVGKKGRKENEV